MINVIYFLGGGSAQNFPNLQGLSSHGFNQLQILELSIAISQRLNTILKGFLSLLSLEIDASWSVWMVGK